VKDEWKCRDLKCKTWNGQKVLKCTACGKPKLKEEQAEAEPPSLLRAGKLQEEVCQRLVGDGADELMGGMSDYPLPLEQQKIEKDREDLTAMIKQLEGMNASASTVQEIKDRLAKLPKKPECQPMRDISTLTTGRLQLKERYAKLDAERDAKEVK
jgi:asparagine synthetase B (glutamine-hydrolysing)